MDIEAKLETETGTEIESNDELSPKKIYPAGQTEDGEAKRQVPDAHIVYHSWEHYSSVRNIDGPASGLPLIAIKESVEDGPASPASDTPTENEIIVMQQCQTDDLIMVRDTLERFKGDRDLAVTDIFERLAYDYESDEVKETPEDIEDTVVITALSETAGDGEVAEGSSAVKRTVGDSEAAKASEGLEENAEMQVLDAEEENVTEGGDEEENITEVGEEDGVARPRKKKMTKTQQKRAKKEAKKSRKQENQPVKKDEFFEHLEEVMGKVFI
jgi:OTU domain-containing protein 3